VFFRGVQRNKQIIAITLRINEKAEERSGSRTKERMSNVFFAQKRNRAAITMKKHLKILIPVLCVLVIGGIIGGYILYQFTYHPSKWLADGDDAVADTPFEEVLDSLDMMDNTWETALSQTAVYDLITDHFSSPLPEGKTAKKAIVIGFDGCRVDLFQLLSTSKKSAINTLLADGGHAVFSYAGGVNYPAENIQATSTAPGWCSMLTGVLSDVHHITDNDIVKEIEPRTLILSLAQDNIVDKTAFYVSWDGHFSRKNATYYAEKQYARSEGVSAVYRRAFFDTGTKLNIASDLKKKDCSDFIFSTLEYTDHEGHNTGFTPSNPRYVSAFRNADATGADIIETIRSRKTYDTEDWLILITTDHGGIGGGHGGPSFEERITFIVSNKDIISND